MKCFRPELTIVRDIFNNNNKYEIPHYQREYSWDKNNIVEYVEDLFIFYDEFKTSFNSDVTVKGYINNGTNIPNVNFLGNIILTTRGDKFEIIDGQQRLTTISLSILALSRIANELSDQQNTFILKNLVSRGHNHNEYCISYSKNNFTNITKELLSKYIDLDLSTKFTEVIEKNYVHLYNEFKKRIDKNFDLNLFISSLLDYTAVIQNSVDSDEDAYVIFERLNTRGRQLEQIDLIKNHIYKVISSANNSELLKDITYKWENQIENEVQNKIQKFIRAVWLSNSEHSTIKELYKQISKKITTQNKEGAVQFVNRLIECTEIFNKLVDKTYSYSYPSRTVKNIVKYLNLLSYDNMLPFLIYILYRYENNDLKIEIVDRTFENIESFFIKNFAILGKSNTYEAKLHSLIEKYNFSISNDTTSISEVDKIFNNVLELDNIDDKQILSSLVSDNFKRNNVLKYFYLKLYNSMHINTEISISNVQLEHIIPQKLSQAWKNDDNWTEIKLEKYTYKIGNTMLLNKKINNKANNYKYSEKLKHYKNEDYSRDLEPIMYLPGEVCFYEKQLLLRHFNVIKDMILKKFWDLELTEKDIVDTFKMRLEIDINKY